MSTARDVLDDIADSVDPALAIADPARVKREVLRLLQFASVADGYVSGARLADMLGTSRQNVHQRAARGRLLVRADEHGVLYPLWQFRTDGAPAWGLTKVISTAHAKGWSDNHLIDWFETDHGRPEHRHVNSGGADHRVPDPAQALELIRQARVRTNIELAHSGG